MRAPVLLPLVTTNADRCRLCYTCVRECPSHAIRISNGRAEVLRDRCIGCGNCVRVCSQGAKQVRDDIPKVQALLDSPVPVAALVAPSFAAEFAELDLTYLVGMLRALGFRWVVEVAFGADLVADRYRRLCDAKSGNRYIATTCPALVAYVEKYHPDLIGNLAPIASPMVATARAVAHVYPGPLRKVFIGPCIAKKREIEATELAGDVDAVLTFAELREMFRYAGVKPETAVPSRIDPPYAGLGALFAVSRGLLKAADLEENLLAGDVVVADGKQNFPEALREFESGSLDSQLLEILCCNGCIMGSGMTSDATLFRRRAAISRYARERLAELNVSHWQLAMREMDSLPLSREFAEDDLRVPTPSERTLKVLLEEMGKHTPADELNCGACGYATCREHATAVFMGLAESAMCLPHTIERLRVTVHELAESHQQLTDAQQALMQSERLASMGQLAAGIAHEVNNPLGVVLLYAHMLMDSLDPTSELHADMQTIVEEADRCKTIVSGLLNFARKNRVALRACDLTQLVDHFLSVVQPPPGLILRSEHAERPLMAEVDPDQITQVLTNLVNNAIAAMPERGTLTVRTSGDGDEATLVVIDTGTGIPEEHRSKIFEPFFTTKQMGMGTGLGLAVTYGIIKMHRGRIAVRSNTDAAAGPTGSIFTINLPRRGRDEETMSEAV
jgi:two-component system NtrC family sensor kinase